MKVTVRFLATFKKTFGASTEKISLKRGDTLLALLEKICDSPERKSEIFTDDAIKPHVLILVNGRPVDAKKGLNYKLSSGDTIALCPFMGGG